MLQAVRQTAKRAGRNIASELLTGRDIRQGEGGNSRAIVRSGLERHSCTARARGHHRHVGWWFGPIAHD